MLTRQRFHANAVEARIEHIVNARHVYLSSDLYCTCTRTLYIMRARLHGSPECMVGHGNIIPNYMIIPFMNSLQPVHYINTRILYMFVCLPMICDISGPGCRSAILLALWWRTSPGVLW